MRSQEVQVIADERSLHHAPLKQTAWHTCSPDEVVLALETDVELGLTKEEVARRLEHYGPNQLDPEAQTPWWRVLFEQFLDPLIYILVIAAIVALAFGKLVDFFVIVVVLIVNAAIGFVQEIKARRAIDALAKMGAPRAEVIRDSESREIDTEAIVPGDIVVLRSGTRVPADIRLFYAQEIEIDESALTGESVPVSKGIETLDDPDIVAGDRKNMAFSGTVVTRGRARGVVVHTAEASELGRIATAVRNASEAKAPVQHQVEKLGKAIGAGILGLTGIVVVVGLLQGRELSEIVMMAIALAVGAIPEALPVVLTITLAVGVQRMAGRKAVLRTLPAVETLGSTTAIGSDKTGTLTRNEMTVKAIWAAGKSYQVSGSGYFASGQITQSESPIDVLNDVALKMTVLAGLLANEAEHLPVEGEEGGGDPTELALLVVAEKAGFPISETRKRYSMVSMIPFESELRYMASLHKFEGSLRAFVKGSPEAIVEMCTHRVDSKGEHVELDSDLLIAESRELAAQGYRVLAMAYCTMDSQELSPETLMGSCVFAGFQAMEDPVRAEAVEAVRFAREAGIRVMMLTGDHVDTARAIGKQLGLGNERARALEGKEIQALSSEELDQAVREVDIYARVAPEHKLMIVEQLKKQGHIVAVTGDGVNDAPALRAAHLGVAMGKGGTDVAREASDMILLDDNFATITAAVEEGRVVFSNIRKVTYFLLSSAVALVFSIVFALFAGWSLPFIAVQVLWINLVTNGLQDVALAFEPREPGLLKVAPRDPSEGLINRRLLARMTLIGSYMGAATVAVFWLMLETGATMELARSVAMTQMVVFQFFHVGNCRSLHRSIFAVPVLSNPFLFVSVLAAILAQLSILYLPFMQAIFQTVPPDLSHWALVVAVGASILLVSEIDKAWLRFRGIGPGLQKSI